MASAIDQNLLELQRIIQQIARTGGGFSHSLGDLNTAAANSSAAQNAASASVRKAGKDSASDINALNKKLRLAGKSFNDLHGAVSGMITGAQATGKLNSSFIKDISTSYQHAKQMLDDQVSKTYTTWSELDKVYPAALKSQIAAVSKVTLDIKNYADVLKVDDYINAQQAFISKFKDNNNKMGSEQLNLLANVHTLSKELGDPDYFKAFAKNKTQAKLFNTALSKHSKGLELSAAQVKVVNEYFKGIPQKGITKALKGSEEKLKGFVQGINGTTKATKEVGGSLKHVMLDQLEKSFGETGSTIRNAISGGMTPESFGTVRAAIGGALLTGVVNAVISGLSKISPMMVSEAEEWMRSGTELHDGALRDIGISQDAYLKISANSKMLYRSMTEGQDGLDKVMADNATNFAKVLGGSQEAGAEMAANVAAVNRVAGGSSQGLEEFSKSVGDAAKWSKTLGESTGWTADAGLKLYTTLLSDTAISGKLNLLKNKERLAMQSSIIKQMAFAATLGMGEEAVKTFVEATTTAGTGGLTESVNTRAILGLTTSLLNDWDDSVKDISDAELVRGQELFDLGENRNAKQNAEFGQFLLGLGGKYAATISTANAEITKKQAASEDTTKSDSERASLRVAVSDFTAHKKQMVESFDKVRNMPEYDAAVKTGINTAINTTAVREANQNKPNLNGKEATPENLAIAQALKERQSAEAALNHEVHDLSLEYGKAIVELRNFYTALSGSQQGSILATTGSAVASTIGGVVNTAVTVAAAKTFAPTMFEGVTAWVTKMGAKVLPSLMAGAEVAIPIAETTAVTAELGVAGTALAGLGTALTGIATVLALPEVALAAGVGVAGYSAYKYLNKDTSNTTPSPDDPQPSVSAPLTASPALMPEYNSIQKNMEAQGTTSNLAANNTQPYTELTAAITTLNSIIGADSNFDTTTMVRYLQSLNRVATDWYKDVQDAKAASDPSGLFGLLSSTGGNSIQNIK